MKNIYLHAICANPSKYQSIRTQRVLLKILEDKALLSLRKQKLYDPSYSFAGLDYISLCDFDKRYLGQSEDVLYNSYNGYIRNSLSFMFPKDEFKILNPTISPISIKNYKGYDNMKRLGNTITDERYSDMPDEVQVKDSLPLVFASGITIPTHLLTHWFFNRSANISNIKYEVEDIDNLLQKNGFNLPIYDIDTFEKLKTDDGVDNTYQYIKMKKR